MIWNLWPKVPPARDLFSGFLEWRNYHHKPRATVEEWVCAPSGYKGGKPGFMNRIEAMLAWTALVGVVAAWLMFEWTRVV